MRRAPRPRSRRRSAGLRRAGVRRAARPARSRRLRARARSRPRSAAMPRAGRLSATSLMARVRPQLKIGIVSRADTLVKRAAPRSIVFVSTSWRPNKRAREEAREPLRRGLPAPPVGRLELRAGGEQVRPTLEQRRRLSGLHVRNDRGAAPRRRRPPLHSMPDRRSARRSDAARPRRAFRAAGSPPARSRRRSGRARRRTGRKAHAPARGDETQRLVLRRGDRTHGLELAQRADEREVVGRDVGQHEQPDGRARRLRSRSCRQVAADAPARSRPATSISHETPSPRPLPSSGRRGAPIRIVVAPGGRRGRCSAAATNG